jgi:2-iminobutanoate/2-iminopropanoate deaminase
MQGHLHVLHVARWFATALQDRADCSFMSQKHGVTTREAPAAVSATQAVTVGRLVFISGQTGRDVDSGALVEGLAAQTHRLFANVDAILTGAGCTNADLVAVTLKFVDLSYFREVDAIYIRWLPRASEVPLPTTTAFVVSALPGGALVELDAVAARPDLES